MFTRFVLIALAMTLAGCFPARPDCAVSDVGCRFFATALYLPGDDPIQLGPITPLYSAATNWNDYIVNDGADIFNATGTACLGSESSWRACVHGGILQQVVSEETECGSLSASDNLGALIWRCAVLNGRATFVSTGFASGKKLSDLIDTNGPDWRAMYLNVSGDGRSGVSPVTRPWPNALAIDNNGILAAEAVSGTIYLVTADPGSAMVIDADKVGLVIVPGVEASALINVTTANYAWVEGAVDLAGGGTQALGLSSAKFSEVRGFRAERGTGAFLVSLNSAENIRMADVNLASGSDCLAITTTSIYNRFSELRASNCSGTGINVQSNDNLFLDTIVVAEGTAGFGLTVGGPSDITILNTTVVASTAHGLNISGGSNSYLANTVAANAGGSGFNITGTTNNGMMNIAAANNFSNGFRTFGGSDNFTWTGRVTVGNNSANDCNTAGSGGSIGIADINCTGSHTTLASADLTSSFTGLISSDSVNTDAGASGTAVAGTITEWTEFENDFRLLAPDGADPMNTALRASCTGGTTCRIYDWSLASSDSTLRAINNIPDGNLTVTHTYLSGIIPTFLQNAVEIMDDGAGDDDGLCESNEDCLYSPNVGAYQGHGNLSALSFTDGTVSGVTLYGYATNGR